MSEKRLKVYRGLVAGVGLLGFIVLCLLSAKYDGLTDKMDKHLGGTLYTAWSTSGVYLARLAFSTLLLASFIKNLLERFAEPFRRDLDDALSWLEQEFSAFPKEAVTKDKRDYYERCKRKAQQAKDEMEGKIREALEKCYPECNIGAWVALAITVLGVDNLLGILSLVLLWPVWRLRDRCQKAGEEAKAKVDKVKGNFEDYSQSYWENLGGTDDTERGKLEQIPRRPPAPPATAGQARH